MSLADQLRLAPIEDGKKLLAAAADLKQQAEDAREQDECPDCGTINCETNH